FFQAEDGIRDFHVTGVQTCALPISQVSVRVLEVTCVPAPEGLFRGFDDLSASFSRLQHYRVDLLLRLHVVSQGKVRGARRSSGRSEERRIGKEGRCGWERSQGK